MNKFDISFFSKYIPEWQEMISVIHTHPITIFLKLSVKIWLLVLLPVIFYYNSLSIQDLIPFYVIEIYLLIMFINIIYDIFDWYNDVWIVTDDWVIWLERSFLKSDTNSLNYENIEGIWVEQDGILDKLLIKWDLVIHKIWDDSFVLKDAVHPLKAVDILETVSEQANQIDDSEEDRFDMIMDALSWVVWNYLENQEYKKEEVQDKTKDLEKIKNNENTIDLR